MAIAYKEVEDFTREALRWVEDNRHVVDIPTGYQSPRISSEIPDCSMPMSFDNLSGCALGCTYCCLKGTSITMGDEGHKSIEAIDIGDTVLSYNINTDIVERDTVSSFMARTVTEIFDIELEDGTVVSLSGEHPVFVKHKGWLLAKDLKENDEIIQLT